MLQKKNDGEDRLRLAVERTIGQVSQGACEKAVRENSLEREVDRLIKEKSSLTWQNYLLTCEKKKLQNTVSLLLEENEHLAESPWNRIRRAWHEARERFAYSSLF